MKLLNPKSRISMGLVGIMTSLVMLAFFLNVVPDRNTAVREGRAALAETIAVYSAALVKSAKRDRLEGDFKLLAERNQDLQSLALRNESGKLLVSTDGHIDHWKPMAGEHSKDSQVRVPLWAGTQKWGQLELRFQPIAGDGAFGGPLKNPMIQLILFMGIAGFIVYYFYLGKVLRQLDPSQAIPGRVRAALDTMAEGLLILDRKEHIVLANESFTTLVDKSPEDLIGYRAGELPWMNTDGKQINISQRPWIKALETGKVQKDRTIRLQLPNGELRTFKTNSSPVLGHGDKHAGVLVSFDDITELEEKEVELRNSKLAAEEANKAKSSFLANMSHEIRSPMNAILGFTEILKRGYVKNEKESLRYLNTIHSSGKNLLELINDILDLSKVESGRLDVESLKIEPYSIIYEVLQMMDVKSTGKGLSLDFKADGALPKEIETDPVRLRQIVFNLVGNAIKFTEKGGITVTCRYEKTSSSLAIDVTDTGIGISDEALKNIFDPFVQADTSVTRRFGGTGLGLAISLRLAKAMGGDLTAKSEEGVGSSFIVTLATGNLDNTTFLQPSEVTKIQQEIIGPEETKWEFSSAKVLVVDDGEENRELVKLLLSESGLSVDEAANGQEGVEKAMDGNYAAILMDVQMPVMDGFTAAGILRDKGLKIPVVALTANAMKGFEEQCIEAGYSDYLSKPINIDQFMDMMAKLLDGRKVNKRKSPIPDAVRGLEEQDVLETTADTSPIVSSLPANNKKLQAIIGRFVIRLKEQLDAMEAAEAGGDLTEVANLAHWLKGAGGTVGFDVFTEPATQLETYAKDGDMSKVNTALSKIRELAGRLSLPEKPKQVVSRLANNKRLQPTISKFVEKLAVKVNEMESALSSKDMAELASLAHWLKGAGGTVGYDDFTQPAEDLEKCAKTNQMKHAVEMLKEVKSLAMAVVPPVIKNEAIEGTENKHGV